MSTITYPAFMGVRVNDDWFMAHRSNGKSLSVVTLLIGCVFGLS